MSRDLSMGSASFALCLAICTSALAASPAVSAVAPSIQTAAKVVAPIKPAMTCLNDVRAFSGKMQSEGYWLGGSAYGYGYPIGQYGYGYGYPMAGYPRIHGPATRYAI